MFPRNYGMLRLTDNEIGDGPLDRIILGETMVVYRDTTGVPIALEDQCVTDACR